MSIFKKTAFIVVLISAVMFPATAFASSGNHSSPNADSNDNFISQLISFFTGGGNGHDIDYTDYSSYYTVSGNSYNQSQQSNQSNPHSSDKDKDKDKNNQYNNNHDNDKDKDKYNDKDKNKYDKDKDKDKDKHDGKHDDDDDWDKGDFWDWLGGGDCWDWLDDDWRDCNKDDSYKIWEHYFCY